MDAPIRGATHDTYSDDGDWEWGDENNKYTDDDNQVEMGAVNYGWNSPPKHRGGHSSYSRSPSPPQRSMSGTSSNSGSPTTRSAQMGGLGPPAAPKGMSMTAAAKGLKFNQPSLLSPTPTVPPALPRKASPTAAPAQSDDIFAELGLAAHPTFSHNHQHQHHHPATTTTPALSTAQRLTAAPAAATSSTSTSPWKTNTKATATATTAFAGAAANRVAAAPAPVAAAASDDWDNWDDDDDVNVKDEWGDNSDLDDLLDD